MVGLTHATRLDAAMCETRRPFWNWVLTSIEDSNIEFSCPAASTKHYLASRGCIHRSKQHIRGQLQRLVMNTIRVMARPERAHLTARATKATPWQKPSLSDCEPWRVSNCEHPIPANFPHAITRTAAAATCTNYNPPDGVAGTRYPPRTCKKSDSL